MAEFEFLAASVSDLSLALMVSIGLFLALLFTHRGNQTWIVMGIVIGGAVVCVYTLHQLTERYHDSLQQQAETKLSEIGQRLDTTLESRLVEARAVGAYLASHPDLTQQEYQRFLDDLIIDPAIYTNLAAARNMTVNLVYPMAGNEAALGLHYPDVPSQWPWIQLSMETRQPVLIGPIDLVQGGRGFIIHHGVFVNEESWGATAAVIPLAGILLNSGVIDLTADYYLSISARFSDQENSETVWATNTEPDTNWATHTQPVPNGHWVFDIQPRFTPALPVTVRNTAILGAFLLTLLAIGVILLLARSRTQSDKAREALETTAYMLDEAQRVGGMGSWSQRPDQHHCELSPQLAALLNMPRRISSGDWEKVVPGDAGLPVRQQLDQLLRGEVQTFSMEHELVTPSGTLMVEHTGEMANRPSAGGPLAVATLIDITEKKATEKQLERLAYFDTLTNIPNRYYFKQELERLLDEHRNDHRQLALLHIDLDHFKDINDSLGHQIGDEVLTIVSKRIGQSLKPGDLLARTGGDEFMAVLSDVRGGLEASQVARRITTKLSSPTVVHAHEVFIGVSIGIALYPDHAHDYQSMYQRADLALYRAKSGGRGNFQLYAEHLAEDFDRRTSLESAMRTAIDQDEFYLEYQPRVDLHSGNLIGMEALLRWRSERFGQIAPDEFIPIAEESGQILTLGRWVLATALREFWQIQALMPESVRLSINLSPRQIQSTALSMDIQQALKTYQVPGHRLDLEITETFIVSDFGQCEAFMQELSAYGIRFSLDDFGTGYSNLLSLRQLPLSALKIDKSFIRNITTDSNHRTIVEAIIQMGHSLDMEVVAEGVETEDQKAALIAMGCSEAQGYLFSRPISITKLVEHWVSRSDA